MHALCGLNKDLAEVFLGTFCPKLLAMCLYTIK